MDQDIDIWAMIEDNNQKMREYLEHAEKSMDIPRSTNSMINKAVNKYLMELVSEFKPENGCCYLVKNLTPETNICFVHKITETERIFENIELSDVPDGTKIGDILVYTEGKLTVSPVVTGEVLKIRHRIIRSLENSLEDFQIEGETYVVCDKSDDAVKPKFSLKTQEGDKEFWGIDIAPELYEQIEYGSIVKFENGKYVLA